MLLNEAAGDPLKKAELINDIADTIAGIPDPVKRSTYVEATAARFGIEASILFGRISATRRNAKDERHQEEPVPQVLDAPVLENRTLAEAEKDLLYFLLTHGCDELDFESDSDYYCGEGMPKPTVADFIRGALEADGTRMANSAFAAAWDAYFKAYDEGYEQEEIVRRMLDDGDRRVASVAASLSTEKYRLTVSAFENALTTTASWLTVQVPRAIMVYGERRIQDRTDDIRRQLAGSVPEEQEKLMQELMRLQTAQRKIKQKIGREKKI